MRFRVDGREFFLGPGEGVTVHPGEVHRFWNIGQGPLRVVHEVQPPGHHRQMFELWHRLDLAGKTDRHGVPRDPLVLGMLWECRTATWPGCRRPSKGSSSGGLPNWPGWPDTKRSGRVRVNNKPTREAHDV